MNARSLLSRSIRIMTLLAAIMILGSGAWFASDIFSAGFARGTFPAELAAHYASDDAGEPTANAASDGQSRELYAQINDEMYSPLHHPEASRLIALNAEDGNAETAPVLTQVKTQCSIRTSVSSLDNLNGLAMNARECF